MKVEEQHLVLPQVKRYLPKADLKHQLKIDDFLLKKKKRLNENVLNVQPCPKKAKMMLNPFNKFNSYYLFNSSIDHRSSHSTKLHPTKIGNQNIQNNQNNQNKINHSSIGLNKSANLHESTNHTTLLFNRKTGLPLSSSPIPQQHKSSFSFERSIKSSNAIKRAILNKEPETDENFNLVVKKPVKSPILAKNLLGSFEVSKFIWFSFRVCVVFELPVRFELVLK